MHAKRAMPLLLLAGMMGGIVLIVFLPGQFYAPPPTHDGSPQMSDSGIGAVDTVYGTDENSTRSDTADTTDVPDAPDGVPLPVAPPADASQYTMTTITRVIDGDTVDVDDKIRIRLSLVDTPERGEPGYSEATEFTSRICAPGTTAAFNVDDGQKGGSYGRTIAEVWCAGAPEISLNELLLENELAVIDSRFCLNSEFYHSEWAQNHGC